jgi:hypothetical protein
MTTTLSGEARRALGRTRRAIRDRRRRHASLQRFEKRRTARKILVVCYGNLCRSPYAGARLAAAGESHSSNA